MTATQQPERIASRRPVATRRSGYVAAIVVNVVMLWVFHHLLEWGWPAFLTEDFDSLLPLIDVSIGATIMFNVFYLIADPAWLRALGDAVSAGIGLALSIRTWQVFPFDFSAYEFNWAGVARGLIILTMVGTAMAMIASIVKLVRSVDTVR